MSDLFSVKAEAETYSGSCGVISLNVKWSLDTETGVLNITTNSLGIGSLRAIKDYSSTTAPWYSYRDSIKTIIIGKGITGIGHFAFYGCEKVTSVTIPDSVTSIGGCAFNKCYSLDSISIPDSVKSIDSDAFSECYSLASVTIPDGVTIINYGTFSNCENLASISIPDSVTSIDSSAFYNCTRLTDVYYTGDINNWSRITFDDSFANPFCYARNLYVNCVLQTEVEITVPDDVTEISDVAFYNCSWLKSITIPNSVTSIGEFAFVGCTSLTAIEIPDGVLIIGDYVFSGCTSLNSITIPEGIIRIGEKAFNGCENLTTIRIPDGVKTIGNYAFSNCTSLEAILISDSVTSLGEGAFDGCRSLSAIIIPDGVTSIGPNTFSFCKNLTTITIPDSVTKIGEYAFCGCRSLSDVYYNGTEEDWNESLVVESNNEYLTNATVHFSGEVSEHQPTVAFEENRVEATCTTAGGYDTVVYCKICGEELSRVETVFESLGHTEGESVVENRVEATCTAEGGYDTVIYCTVCGKEVLRETTVFPTIDHELAEAVEENRVAATCTKNGSYDTVVYCSVCEVELSRVTIIVEAFGHDAAEAVEEKRVEASCTKSGSYDLVVCCTVCGEELSRERIEIPALSHIEGESVVENRVKVTCTTDGSFDTVVYCTVCKAEISREKTVTSAEGHAYETMFFAPCCTEVGYTEYTCTVCGDTYIADIVPALGHREGKWVITKEAEVGVAGEETLYCSTCCVPYDTREIPPISAYFRAAEGTTTVVDKERGIIYGLAENISDLEGFVEYEGGILKYKETSNGFGTGTVVNFIVNGEVYESYTIIIFGDLTGDGVIDTYDVSKLAKIANFDVEVEEGSAVAIAADIAENDGIADTYDLAKLYHAVNFNTTISQVQEILVDGSIRPGVGRNPDIKDYDSEAKITTVLSKGTVNTDDIVTVTIKLTSDYYVTNVQLPVLFDKTQFEIVGKTTNSSFYTASEMFADRNYTFSGRADRQQGFDKTSNAIKWNTDDAKAQYGVAYITATYDASNGAKDTTFAKPQDEVFVTFQLKALKDVKDISDSVFVSTDWAKTAENRGGLLTVGMTTVEDYDAEVAGIHYANVSYTTETTHIHTPDEAVVENRVEPDCVNKGSYDSVVYCEDCGEKLSTTSVEIPAAHTPGEAKEENRVEPDWYNVGSHELVVYCSVCGIELSRKTEIIPACKVFITVVPDKTIVLPGEEIRYTIVMYSDYCLVSMAFTTAFPDGLNYVDGSGVIDSNAKKELGFDAVEWVEWSLRGAEQGYNFIYGYGYDTNQISHGVTICTFKAKADDNALGEYVVNLVGLDEFMDDNWDAFAESDIFVDSIPIMVVDSLDIEIDKTSVELSKNLSSVQLTADVYPEEYADRVVWSSSNESVAKVDRNGLVTRVGEGTATITAKLNGSDYKGATCNVTVIHECENSTLDFTHEIPAGCDKSGTAEYYKCTCGKLYLDEMAVTEVNIDELLVPALGHKDGKEVIENNITPTCTEKGSYDTVVYCSVCDEELSRKTDEVSALGHKDGKEVIENNILPTCTEKGSYDTVVYCSVCDEELSRETIAVDIVPHDCQWITDKEPTCITVGYKHEKCRNCDFTRNENTVIEKLPHDTQKYAAVAPTCTSVGNIEYFVCRDCGKCFSDVDYKNEISVFAAMLPALGHSEGEEVRENEVDATTDSEGSYDLVVYCEVCGKELSRETVIVPVISHEPGEATEENRKEATCTETGSYDSVIYCTVCGEELSRETVEIPAIGHVSGEKVVENTVDATCTTRGSYDSVIYCTVCEEELLRETVKVDVISHNYERTIVPATCIKNGYTESVCISCGDRNIEDLVPAFGHSYEEVVTPPTQTDMGYTTYTCTVCGDKYVDNFVGPVTGFTVSGTVTSFGDTGEVVTITLTLKGETEPAYTTTASTGKAVAYSFESVPSGEYIMTVSMDNHVTRTYEVTVAENEITADVKIHLTGDINGDGKVNTVDVARANAQAKGVATLSDYEFQCANVNNKDSKVNTVDVARINAHAKGVTALW